MDTDRATLFAVLPTIDSLRDAVSYRVLVPFRFNFRQIRDMQFNHIRMMAQSNRKGGLKRLLRCEDEYFVDSP
jgi:hypothetical protein